MKIRAKLVLAFLACGILPLVVASLLSYRTASGGMSDVQDFGNEALEKTAYNQLVALRDVKKGQVEAYYAKSKQDLQVLAENLKASQQEAYKKLSAINQLKRDQIEQYFQDRLDLMSDVQANLRFTGGVQAFTDVFAQGLDSEAYRSVEQKRHAGLKAFNDSFGFYDVFLIDRQGNVVYTVAKEADLGENLISGKLKDSGLAQAFNRGKENISLIDYAWYAPSNEPAAFISTPLKDASGRWIGVAAFQVSSEQINRVVQQRAGMTQSAESYLVGRDADGGTSLRSDRVIKSGKIGDKESDRFIDAALAGKSGADIKVGSSGELEVIQFDPVKIAGVDWCLISSGSLEEVISPKLDGQDEDFLTRFNNTYGYYDLFLISPAGDCFYTVYHEPDYQTNLVDGKFKNSNLGELVRKVLASKRFGFADFEPYAPSNGAPAAFIAQPIVHEGKVELIVALQMPLDTINQIMGMRAGMGETGETYLVGSDKLMRSDSFLDPTHHTVAASFDNPSKGSADTEAVNEALSGKTDAKIIEDYNGNPVLSAYTPVQVFDTRWALLAEIDEAEALAAVSSMEEIGSAASTSLITWSAGVAFIAIFGIAIAAFFIASNLAKPIIETVALLKIAAEGDLTQRVNWKRKDEFGEFAQWFNMFVGKVHDIVSDVAGSAREVAGASTQIAASSEEMASGMTEQASQITQISSAVEEMTASVVEVSRKASEAATNATDAGKIAEQGGEVVADTIRGMNSISEAVTASAASVSELGKRGEQIGQIIDVINDIADQTNLLALNAAIEAARAGEHGRGFAVVADEVRKLADRTTKATEEIAGSIKAIQTETGEAVERMNAGTEQVDTGVVLAKQAGASLGEIVQSTQGVAELIQSIAAAAEEQSAASEEISQSIESISAVTSQATEGANQSAAAASQLSSKAEQLQQIVSQFKLREGSANQDSNS